MNFGAYNPNERVVVEFRGTIKESERRRKPVSTATRSASKKPKLPKLPFRPLGAQVIIKVEAPVEVTKGGIMLPVNLVGQLNDRGHNITQEPTRRGQLVAKGPDVTHKVDVGQFVMYQGGYGSHDEYGHEGEKYHVIDSKLLLCVFDGE